MDLILDTSKINESSVLDTIIPFSVFIKTVWAVFMKTENGIIVSETLLSLIIEVSKNK